MGDFNQLAFIERHVGQFEGPFLEVGSKDYGSTPGPGNLSNGATNRRTVTLGVRKIEHLTGVNLSPTVETQDPK